MLTQEQLKELLEYFPDTGSLYWRERGPHWFKTIGKRSLQYNMDHWNSRHANTPAERLGGDGKYWWITLPDDPSKPKVAHRVIWRMEYGDPVPTRIDHDNGNRKDNRLVNLVASNAVLNARNTSIYSNNKTGKLGVAKFSVRGRDGITVYEYYQVKIGVGDKGRPKYIGSYKTFDEAVSAREVAEKVLGYHENHGRPKIIDT